MLTLIAETIDIRGNLDRASGVKLQTDPGALIGSYVGVAILIAGMLTFGYLILGSISWVTSGGDKGKVEKAQQMIMQAVIGLALVAASYAIFQVIQYFLGFDILAI